MKNKSGKHAHTKRNRETETGKEKDTFLDVAHDEYEQKRTEQSGRKMKAVFNSLPNNEKSVYIQVFEIVKKIILTLNSWLLRGMNGYKFNVEYTQLKVEEPTYSIGICRKYKETCTTNLVASYNHLFHKENVLFRD